MSRLANIFYSNHVSGNRIDLSSRNGSAVKASLSELFNNIKVFFSVALVAGMDRNSSSCKAGATSCRPYRCLADYALFAIAALLN